jgi:hypothetical protein
MALKTATHEGRLSWIWLKENDVFRSRKTLVMGRHPRGLTGREIEFTDGVATGQSFRPLPISRYAESTAPKKLMK